MFTAEPGPDVALYHSRQVVVLGPEAWPLWLGGEEPEAVLHLSAAGSLAVEAAA